MPIEDAERIQYERVAALQATLAALPAPPAARTLEIGCGHGHFLTAYAEAHPDEFCLAIDIIGERLERAARKTTRAGLTNVHWLHANANDLLSALPADLHFNRHVFILFPDPWPKRRHWKNRLIQTPFLSTLAAVCEPGTRLCFRTDYAPYFAVALATTREHPDWTVEPTALWPFEQRTVFEARADSHQSFVAVRHS